MKNSLQTWDLIRKLYDIQNDSKNSIIIILLSIRGKDMDSHVTYEILQYSLNLFLGGRQNSHRVFIRGDQKLWTLLFGLKNSLNTSISIISLFPTYIFENHYLVVVWIVRR